jgi:hypothetical protein
LGYAIIRDLRFAAAHHHVARSQYSPSALVFFGGPAVALVFDCRRKRQFRCEKCGTLFSRHTLTSRFFQIFWVWFILSIVGGIALLIAGYDVR